jgi:hypothetical protein
MNPLMKSHGTQDGVGVGVSVGVGVGVSAGDPGLHAVAAESAPSQITHPPIRRTASRRGIPGHPSQVRTETL